MVAKIAVFILASLVASIALLELGLRLLFGFGNPPIYLADREIGYLLAPNQRSRRFGNLIQINEYSMRSPSVAPLPPSGTLRILLLGDSIANGGWWTPQDQTISAAIAKQLRALAPPLPHPPPSLPLPPPLPHPPPSLLAPENIAPDSSYKNVEVLNASANSWGPRNELAYARRKGTFGAALVVLLINTDDLFAKAPSSLQVGSDRNYPAVKPPLALVELFQRYILPAPAVPAPPKETGDIVGRNLEAISDLQNLVAQTNSQLLLAMTPLQRETGEPGPRDYERKARERLLDLTQKQKIYYLDFLPQFNSLEEPATLYRDHIHLSPSGNELVSETISKAIQQLL
ncbi:MAG: SGNH/GDSL hydrolase family protein [Oscillatoria sp. SIO1A7]|nr:SGNH/GDSL hydrolase family protein [Oscillatoria sp. SIO1A7]